MFIRGPEMTTSNKKIPLTSVSADNLFLRRKHIKNCDV